MTCFYCETFPIFSVPDVGDAVAVSKVTQEQRDIQKQVEKSLTAHLGATVVCQRFQLEL